MKWPDPELFPYVDRVWKHDSKLLDIQYWRLVQRLQSFYRTTRGKQQWGSVKGYRVIAVSVQEGRTAAALRKKLTQCGADQLTASVLCGLTSAFVAGEQPAFFVSAAAVARLGYANARRGLRLKASQFRGREGSVGSIRFSRAMSSLSSKVVRVVSVQWQLDENNVLVSLDMEQRWNVPRQEDSTTTILGLQVYALNLEPANPFPFNIKRCSP